MARDAASPKKQKPLVLSPTAKVEALFRPIAAAPGELLALAENGVRFFDRGGAEVARDHVGESSADYIVVSGDSLVAWQRHSSYAPILVDCARKTASVWADGKQLVLPRFAPAGPRRFVAYDSSKLFVVDGDGTAVAVHVAHLLGKGQHIGRARMLDDDILVEICGPDRARHYFHTALVGRDGTERWRLAGNGVTVHQGRVLLFADAGVLCVDAAGRVIGRVDDIRPQSGLDYLEECFLLDGDDVFVASGTSLALLRPHESKLVWSTALPTTSESIKMPVLAKHDGRRIFAASAGQFCDDKTVYFVDGDDGRVLHAENAAGSVIDICAIQGRDAFVARSYTKKQVGWRDLTSSPRRLTLQHDEKVFDLESHAPGAVAVHTGDHLVFWSIDSAS